MRLAVAAAPIASLLLPCDVVNFCSTSALLQDDFAMRIMVACVKEPLPVAALVEAWEQLPAHYAGSDLRSAVSRALAAADGAPHTAELDQLHCQGVGRMFGLISTARNFGIIGKKKAPTPRRSAESEVLDAGADASTLVYRLGKNLTEYEVLDPAADKSDEFLRAARAQEHDLATARASGMSDLIDYGTQRAPQALQRIGTASGALPFNAEDAEGYCVDFLVRKLVAARVLQQRVEGCDWSSVDKATLQAMSADAKENLEAIPATWHARKISCFLTGRPDWALFASAFPCLWGEVAVRLVTDDEQTKAIELIRSEAFQRVVLSYRDREGVAPHPAVAYRIAASQGPAASPRTLPSSGSEKGKRASTPLEKPPRQRASTQRGKRKRARASTLASPRALPSSGSKKGKRASTLASPRALPLSGSKKRKRASTPLEKPQQQRVATQRGKGRWARAALAK